MYDVMKRKITYKITVASGFPQQRNTGQYTTFRVQLYYSMSFCKIQDISTIFLLLWIDNSLFFTTPDTRFFTDYKRRTNCTALGTAVRPAEYFITRRKRRFREPDGGTKDGTSLHATYKPCLQIIENSFHWWIGLTWTTALSVLDDDHDDPDSSADEDAGDLNSHATHLLQ